RLLMTASSRSALALSERRCIRETGTTSCCFVKYGRSRWSSLVKSPPDSFRKSIVDQIFRLERANLLVGGADRLDGVADALGRGIKPPLVERQHPLVALQRVFGARQTQPSGETLHHRRLVGGIHGEGDALRQRCEEALDDLRRGVDEAPPGDDAGVLVRHR